MNCIEPQQGGAYNEVLAIIVTTTMATEPLEIIIDHFYIITIRRRTQNSPQHNNHKNRNDLSVGALSVSEIRNSWFALTIKYYIVAPCPLPEFTRLLNKKTMSNTMQWQGTWANDYINICYTTPTSICAPHISSLAGSIPKIKSSDFFTFYFIKFN